MEVLEKNRLEKKYWKKFCALNFLAYLCDAINEQTNIHSHEETKIHIQERKCHFTFFRRAFPEQEDYFK